MGDPIYINCLASLTFGVDTIIGYCDLSDKAVSDRKAEALHKSDEAEGAEVANETWITGDGLIKKLPYLSWLSGRDLPKEDVSDAGHSSPHIVFLAAYGLPRNREIAIQRDHFLDIMSVCHFPPAFYETMCEKTGHFARFVEFGDENTVEWISVVLKTPHTEANFSLVVRTRLSDRSTVCFLIIQDDDMLCRITRRLVACKASLQETPLQILHIICQEYGSLNETWRQELDHLVVEMEQRIVMASFDIESVDRSISEDEPLIRRLHRTNTNLTWLDCTTNFEWNSLRFSLDVFELCETLRGERGLASLSRRSRAGVEQRIKSSMNSCSSRQYHVRGLQERAKVQLSSLSSQISQRDSRINLSTARDSKDIARSTLRDGKAMKTIAVLGLVFLPATLIASIYGTGIFDFRTDGVVVSSLWWTYAVATAGLTCLVLMIWAFYIRQESRDEMRKKFDDMEKGEKSA